MGLLDEAIREHLELKRRRGADPAEIERLEREALGPVRRVQENGEPLFEAGQQTYEEEPYAAAGPKPEAPLEAWEYEQEEALLPGESWVDDEVEPSVRDVQPLESEPPVTPPPPAAAPPPAPATAPPAPEPEPSGETVEYDVEAEPGSERDDDDVLEETPEFFQDAPEHDRLWFEQRPPRDFDFDG